MSFQAKRLRVQLPCGDTTVRDDMPDPGQDCLYPTLRLCYFPTLPQCYYPTIPNCGGVSPTAQEPITTIITFTGCGVTITCGGSPEADPRTLVVRVEDLPVLRAQLESRIKRDESQLKEVELAEQAVKDQAEE
jgi:hypothetical protein